MRIRTFNKIAQEGLNLFENRIPSVHLGSDIGSPDVIVLRSHKLKLEECEGVTAVARAGAGVNNVPVQELSERGVIVFNTPGANANAVAELTIASMIVEARNMVQARRYFGSSTQRLAREEADGASLAQRVECDKKQFKGSELRGSKLAVVGLGAIGSAVAQLAQAFGMDVIGYDPYIQSSVCLVTLDLRELLENTEYVSFHVPPTEETKRLASGILDRLGSRNSVILNFSRGELFSNTEVLAALDTEQSVRRYITDFPNDEIVSHPKVICYPHIGASTEEAETNCSLMAAEQLCDLWEHGAIKNSVNFPTMPLAICDRGATRVLFLHRNEPGVLKNITSRLADMSVNVVDMINRAKGEYAASLVDFNGASSVVSALESKPISGVLGLFKVVGRQP